MMNDNNDSTKIIKKNMKKISKVISKLNMPKDQKELFLIILEKDKTNTLIQWSLKNVNDADIFKHFIELCINLENIKSDKNKEFIKHIDHIFAYQN